MSAREPKSTSQYIDLPNGTKLYTERWTTSSINANPLLTFICIHGLGSTSTTFFPIIEPILSHFPTAHILAYDWAGSGSSPLPTAPYPVSAHVADLDALIAAEAPSGALVLLAHSAGTVLGARWLLAGSPRATARVTHVAFLGGPIGSPVAPAVTAMQRELAATVAAAGPGAIVGRLMGMLLGSTTLQERPLAVGMLRAVTLAQSAEGYAAAIRAFSQDVSTEGERIDWVEIQERWRVIVVNGEEDVMVVPADVAKFLNKCPNMTIERAGHTLTVEAPEETAEVIVGFITGETALIQQLAAADFLVE